MKHYFYSLTCLAFLGFLCGCNLVAGNDGKLSKPKEAHVDLSDQTLTKFDAELSRILFRYLAGNPRWEIREEKGLRYAVRLEKEDGKFKTTLNGFYSTNDGVTVRQTRVLISFGKAHGFGRERGNVSRTKPGQKDVPLIIEGKHFGTPGNSSYTIIDGGQVFLEIYDQAPEIARTFTQRAFNEVCDELTDVLKHRKSIEKKGTIPVPERYPMPLLKKSYFEVNDGMQPGIYLINAAIGQAEPGYVFLKTFNVKSGDRLSPERMTPRSIRYLGWSDDGKTLFHYRSRVTIYEGDWSTTYKARFELWHRSDKGIERKITEKTRMINGWQR